MASYISIFLCLVCIILVLILLFRFKKLFSTESIIEKTKSQMNKMITDINNHTSRDIDLINDSSKRLRALLNDADQKMEQFKQATDRLREMIAITENLENQKGYESYIRQNQNVSNIKPIGQKKSEIVINQYKKNESNAKIDPDASYSVNKIQNSLFDEVETNSQPILKDETTVLNDGSAYKEVPLIVTKVFDEKPVINKTEKNGKQLNENIVRLFNQGLQVEDIAKKLSCSITEVQFIIDML